ncbi:hypothetical protein L4X63_08700 [Geomonas sp. Red32]|uniref:hypothetical protein n=1 Tax=Geomonas sp. Red32 TaxID=2912856 RepID=UPI00202D0B2A|nr:hypothetical protein [Geomonas sp. Red32]MCM0081664.1 hypothetical protein [Geomonas sp. Red32]
MDELKFNGTGTDASFLANVNTFFTTLFALAIFQQGWPEEKLGSQSVLQKCTDWFREMFEGSRTGNRLHIAARKTARKDLDGRIQKILHYVAVMAEERDIDMLLNTSVVTKKSRKRVRKAVKAVAAN